MSPSPKQSRARAGFTLTEVLVSVAIFVTVIGSVFGLFSVAVSTVRTGYNSIDNMAEARTALGVLNNDLEVAYTAREFGDPNQFFGRPEGFMFVGKLSTGKEGRVTYVINPNASSVTFTSTIGEPWEDTRARLFRQAWEAGYNAAKAQGFGEIEAQEAGENIGAQMNLAFNAAFPDPVDGIINGNNSIDPYEFPVNVTTYGLLRYEEADRRDLDSFDLPDPITMEWPYIDLVDPDRDTPGAVAEGTPTGVLYDFLISAIGNPNDADMRDVISAFRSFDPVNYDAEANNANLRTLRAVDTSLVDTLIKNKKREYWIRLLADDPAVADMGRFWTNDPLDGSGKKNIRDFLLTERILNRATLIDPGTGQPFSFAGSDGPTGVNVFLREVDALKVPGIFSYGFTKTDFSETNPGSVYLNTLERLPARSQYEAFLRTPSVATLQDLDRDLEGVLAGGGNSVVWQGSPLVPRLPGLVQVRFWIADEKVLPNAVDFRRLFTQLMQVPAGASRDLSNQGTQSL